MIPVILPPHPGPMVPLARPLPRASVVADWTPNGIEAHLRDLPGAVVVVEDEAPRFNLGTSLRSLLETRVKLMAAGLPPQLSLSTSAPLWSDPSVIRAGGNVVHRVYGLGGARY